MARFLPRGSRFGTGKANGSRVREILEQKAAEKAARQGDDVFDPSAVRKPMVEQPSLIMPSKPGFDPAPQRMQERSGIFDYDYKLPFKDSGVQRFQPPRGVPQRSQDLLSNRNVFDQMVEGTRSGLEKTGGQDWYEAGPMFKSFIDEFGPDEGNRRFEAFMTAVAGTSPRSNVGENIRNASYYYGKVEGEPGRNEAPDPSFLDEKNPYPYGHYAQNLHKGNVRKTMFEDSPGFGEKNNPKPLSFLNNFLGDTNLVTVDTHAFRAPAMLGEDPRFLETRYGADSSKKIPGRDLQQALERGEITMEEALRNGPMWQSKPRENEYAAWEDYYRRIAGELGVTPRAAQGGAWIGHGGMTGLDSAPKPFMDFVEERILKTARERGMDPKDVWREAIRGTRPLTMDERILQDMPGASAAA